MCINLLDIGVTMFVLFSNNEYFVARALARTGAATPASPADSPAEARAVTSDGPALCFEDENKRQNNLAKYEVCDNF